MRLGNESETRLQAHHEWGIQSPSCVFWTHTSHASLISENWITCLEHATNIKASFDLTSLLWKMKRREYGCEMHESVMITNAFYLL